MAKTIDHNEENNSLNSAETARKYKFFFEQSSSLNIIVNDQGIIRDVNRAFTEGLGYERDYIIGKSAIDFIDDGQKEYVLSLLQSILTGEDVGDATIDVITADGKRRTLYFPETDTGMYRGENGEVEILFTAIDITPLRQAQEELRIRNERFREIFEGAGDGIIYTNPRGVVVAANKAFTTITGLNADDVIGKQAVTLARKFLRMKDIPRILSFIKKTLSGGSIGTYEIEFRGKTLEISTPFVSNDSTGITGIIRDITKRKEIEDILILQRNLGDALSAESDLNRALETILDYICAIDGIDAGAIYLHNSVTGMYEVVTHRGFGKDFIECVRSYGQEFRQHMKLSAGKPFYIRYQDIEPIMPEKCRKEGLRSIGSIPIMYQGKTIAALNIASRSGDEIPQLSRHMTEAVADRIGAVIVRMKAESLLRESERRFRALFESANDIIFIKDTGFRYTHVNPAMARLLDTPEEKLTGKTDYDLFPSEEADSIRKADEAALKGEFVEKDEELTIDGERMTFHVIKAPMRDKTGAVTGVCGFTRDITERKKYERDLHESEDRFRRLAEASREGIIITENGIILDCNEAYESIIGRTRSEIIGANVLMFTAPESRALVTQAITENKESRYENVGLKKDGSRIILEAVGRRIPYLGRTVRIATIRDITEQKRAEESIRSSLEEKEVLLREIHHRVKNNLQVISSLLMLQADRIQDENSRQMFRESINRIHSMAAIHEMLYRTESLSHIRTADYITHLCQNLKSAFSHTSGRIEIHVDTGDIRLELDTAIPCGLIVNELVTNALKYAFSGAERGKIEVMMEKTGNGDIVLTVADNGSGIPVGLDWRNTDTLGLKIVRLLTEHQLNGTIELRRDAGTMFVIRFGHEEQQ